MTGPDWADAEADDIEALGRRAADGERDALSALDATPA